MSLNITITPESDNGKRISIAGSLDSNTAPQLQQSIDAEIDESVDPTVIDFKDLDYISSAGLRVILKATKNLKNADGKLVLCAMQDYVKEVFEISGFDSFLPIVPTIDEAVKTI